MKPQPKPKAPSRAEEIAIDTPIDYSNNMFKDGNNRTRNNPDVRLADAAVYDEAAHQGEADFGVSFESEDIIGMLPEAAQQLGLEKINADEEGEPLGGTPEELDAMEVEGKPVDRTDRMKY